MKCKDCINSDVCNCFDDEVTETIAMNLDGEECKLFKDKSKFIELPCKKGDYVVWEASRKNKFYPNGLYRIYEVLGFEDTDDLGLRINLGSLLSPVVNHSAIKGIYFTRKEAEARLKELEDEQK